MEVKKKSTGPVINFNYIKSLGVLTPEYLNKMMNVVKAGAKVDNEETEWYSINGTNYIANLHKDNTNNKMYIKYIAKFPSVDELSKHMEETNILNDDDDENIIGGAKKPKKKPSTAKPKPKPKPKVKPKPKTKMVSSNKKTVYEIDYSDIDEYGGKTK